MTIVARSAEASGRAAGELLEHDDPRPPSDRDPEELDDRLDRDELRDRYYGLLQELRVLLPGVQVMVAFLLAVPFADRFEQVTELERVLYGVAIFTGMLSVVAFMAPTAFHRLGLRTARSRRLRWAIRATVAGIACLAVSLVTAIGLVGDFVFGAPVGAGMAAVLAGVMVGVWVALPRRGRNGAGPT